MNLRGTKIDFCLPDKDNNTVCLHDFHGKWVVLYFYPKDKSKGCTLEAVDFTNALKEFEALNAVVVGVSPDPVVSHKSFAEKHDLGIILLSDVDHAVLEQYKVWQLKKMYGKEYFGVVRTTVIIDPDGFIRHVWEKVKVKNHANNVKTVLTALQVGP